MKIYPSQIYHCPEYIIAKNNDKDLSVPLAYLNNDNSTYKFQRVLNSDFSVKREDAVLPYQELPSGDVLLFDKSNNQVDTTTLIKKDEYGYKYIPDMIVFEPLTFTYRVTAQKKLTYANSNVYNLGISCLDDPHKLDFTNKLQSILLSDNEDMLKNIRVKDDTIVLNTVDNKPDFVFIESPDGDTYNFFPENSYVGDEEIAATSGIALNRFLEDHINTWIISDSNIYFPASNGTGYFVELTKPQTKQTGKFHIKDYYNVGDPMFVGYKIHNLFENSICPIMIIEHPNKGFVIYSTSEVFSNTEQYRDLIYEVLVYVYCNSYMESDPVKEYITYAMPDYEVINNTLVAKSNFASRYSLSEILKTNIKNLTLTDLKILDTENDLPKPDEDISTLVENIKYNGISNNKIQFKMTEKGTYDEPTKPAGWKSIYYNDKIYYLEEIHYLLETRLGESGEEDNKIFLNEMDSDLKITVYPPVISSKHGLNIQGSLSVIIPSFKTDVNGMTRAKNEAYALLLNKKTKELQYLFNSDYESKLISKEEEDRAAVEDLILLATIAIIEQPGEGYLTDLRIRGGGLPEDMPDNFNLLDIGHIYGRPYRKANTLVFTLPKKYEIYKDEILEAINKYKVAEDYVAIFFEDQETDGE